MSFEKTNSEKDAIIAEKDKQISAIQAKIDDMTNQFREMLQVFF
jgi:vacuolar-type H+-ATPase subunit H